MWNIKISGFSDEACESFEEQLKFMNKLGIKYIEIRGVDGKNISELTPEEVMEVKDLLEKYSIKVSSIGSPIGKISILDDFSPHLQLYINLLRTARILDTKYIRIFSFYIPDGENPEKYRDEVLKRLSAFIEIASREGFILLHENEKGIYGDNAERCWDLMKSLYCYNFNAVFDFANFVQVGQDTMSAYNLLNEYIKYVHIKDAVGADVVPAGMGNGMVKEILCMLKNREYSGFLSLEPHLADFAGFTNLESNMDNENKMSDSKFAWTVALNSLKSLLHDLDADEIAGKKMRSAIVGCGGIAQVHANVLKNLPLTELTACADIKFDRAEKMALEYGCTPYSSLEEMLQNEKIDVLHICTPHYLHTPMAELAAQKGIKIFTEKPPVISYEQWEGFSALKNKTPVGICFQNRYNRSVQHIKGLLKSGAAGKILGARAVVTWSRGDKYYTESGWRGSLTTEGGGVLINQSIHTLDLLIQFMGAPTEVEATCINHHLKDVIEVEDTLEAYIKFEDSAAIFFATTAYTTDSPVMVELNCENMIIKMEEQRITVIHSDKSREEITFTEPETLGKAYWGNGHYTCIEDYYRHILKGEEPPINIDNVKNTVKTMLAIYKSARESHKAEKI